MATGSVTARRSNNSSCSGSGSDAWTIPDEANNGLIHSPYVLSMAKTSAPNTGGSQFFIVDRIACHRNLIWMEFTLCLVRLWMAHL